MTERRLNRLRERTPPSRPFTIHAMERLWSLCTCTSTFSYVCTSPPISNREGRSNIFHTFCVEKQLKPQHFFLLIAATLSIKDLYSSYLKLSLFRHVLIFKVPKFNHTSIFLSGICSDDCVVLLDAKNTESFKLLITVLSKGKSKAFVWMLC